VWCKFGTNYPDMDMISFDLLIHVEHSPHQKSLKVFHHPQKLEILMEILQPIWQDITHNVKLTPRLVINEGFHVKN
jgi:hypothetical protein